MAGEQKTQPSPSWLRCRRLQWTKPKPHPRAGRTVLRGDSGAAPALGALWLFPVRKAAKTMFRKWGKSKYFHRYKNCLQIIT